MNRRILIALSLAALFALTAAQPACAAWSRPQRLGGPPGGIQAQIAVSGQAIDAVWFTVPGEGFTIYHSRSTDCGETWSTPQPVVATRSDFKLDLAASGEDVHLVWVEREAETFGNRLRFEILQTASRNGGESWSSPRRLSPERRWTRSPSITANGQDVYVAYILGGRGPKQHTRRQRIVVAASDDGGRSWLSRRATPRHSDLRRPQIALGQGTGPGRSRLHLVWPRKASGGGFDEPRELLYQVSDDGGARWSEPLQVNHSELDKPGSATPTALVTLGGGAHVLWNRNLASNRVAYNGTIGGRFRPQDRAFGGELDPDSSMADSGVLAAGKEVLHAAWIEFGVGVGSGIFTVRSHDRGETWSRPKSLTRRPFIGRPAIAASTDTSGACRGSSHVLYSDDGRVTYRRRPRTLD